MTIGLVSRLLCLAASTAAFSYGGSFSKCDVNQDGATGIVDVQTVVNEALGGAAASDDLNSDGAVNIVDVEIVVNAGAGWACAADPGLVSIVPNSGQQGASSLNVTVTGRLTSFTGGSTIGLGPGITVSNVAAADALTLTATLAIDAGASPGPRNLTVDAFTLPNAFTVSVPSSVSYTYDSQGRLSTASYLSGAGTVTVVTYTYDAAGNRLTVVAK